MKMNRKLVLILSLVLSLALATGSTLAYLSDTDADVNVMTLGSVTIRQLEYERVVENGAWVSTGETDKYGYTPDKVQPFTQGKPLFPAVFGDGTIKWDDRPTSAGDHQQSWGEVGAPGSNQLFDDSVANALDKFVFVENTGKSDAYVRTWFAFEQGSLSAADFDRIISTNGDAVHWSWETVATDVEIEGGAYVLCVATYLGPTSDPTGLLAPGAITYPSLLQVYMSPEATNDDVAAIDGNGNGTYDILVVSQAIQAAGFTSAGEALNEGFGEPTVENHPWVDGIIGGDEEPGKFYVNNAQEMYDALLAAEHQDIYGRDLKDFRIETTGAIELDAQNATVHLAGQPGEPGDDDYSYFGFVPPKGEDVVLSNLTVTGSGFVEVGHHGTGGGDYTITNLTIRDLSATLCVNNCGFNVAGAFSHYGKATLNNCVMTGTTTTVEGFTPYDAAFVNGSKTIINGGVYGHVFLANQAHVTIYDAEVELIDSCAITAGNLGKLTIGAGAHVGVINLTPGSYKPALVIEDGATVDKIVYNGVTYTQAEWMAR